MVQLFLVGLLFSFCMHIKKPSHNTFHFKKGIIAKLCKEEENKHENQQTAVNNCTFL
jgi:hypothetical protein